MKVINEIAKEYRSDISKMVIDSPYSVGKKDGLTKALMILDAVQMTKKCPKCNNDLSVEFSEKEGELIMYCELYGCNYELPLNQIGY